MTTVTAPRFRVYCDTGDAVETDDPRALPPYGVLAIVQRDPDVGRAIVQRRDFYWYDPRYARVIGGDIHGLLDFLAREGLVAQGRTVPDAVFRTVLARAIHDSGFPAKSALTEEEARHGLGVEMLAE